MVAVNAAAVVVAVDASAGGKKLRMKPKKHLLSSLTTRRRRRVCFFRHSGNILILKRLVGINLLHDKHNNSSLSKFKRSLRGIAQWKKHSPAMKAAGVQTWT